MCTASNVGMVARRYDFNFQLGFGRQRFEEDLPGVIGDSPNEINQMGFYSFWNKLMTSDSWAEVER
jgi:hypothetical protein